MSRFRRKPIDNNINPTIIVWKIDPRSGIIPLLSYPDKIKEKGLKNSENAKINIFMNIIRSEKVFSNKWTILPLHGDRLGMFYAFFSNYWYVLTLNSKDSSNLVIFTEEILPELDNIINLYFLVRPEKKWDNSHLKTIYNKYLEFSKRITNNKSIDSQNTSHILPESSI